MQELLQQHRQVIKQQDETLDVLDRGAQNLRSVAVTIHDEVGVHAQLLQELDEGIEHVDTRLAGVRHKLASTLRKMDQKLLNFCLFFVSMFSVMCFIWFLKRL